MIHLPADLNPLLHPILRQLATVRLTWHDAGPMGCTTFATRTISLRRNLTWTELRCTLVHELVHLARGPSRASAKDEEKAVRRHTALVLLPDFTPIVTALEDNGGDIEKAADALFVDPGLLRERIDQMTAVEHLHLARLLGEHQLA